MSSLKTRFLLCAVSFGLWYGLSTLQPVNAGLDPGICCQGDSGTGGNCGGNFVCCNYVDLGANPCSENSTSYCRAECGSGGG